MLYMAIVESILLIVILFFFKEIYMNKYGQYSLKKDDISEEDHETDTGMRLDPVNKLSSKTDGTPKSAISGKMVSHFDSLESSKKEDTDGTKAQLKMLINNCNYVLLVIGASLLIAVTYAFPTVLEQIIIPYHYNS
jgi:hypothetical protein